MIRFIKNNNNKRVKSAQTVTGHNNIRIISVLFDKTSSYNHILNLVVFF